MKGCYYTIFVLCDIVGLFFIASTFSIGEEEGSVAVKIFAVILSLFLASCFFLPHILYLMKRLKNSKVDNKTEQTSVTKNNSSVNMEEYIKLSLDELENHSNKSNDYSAEYRENDNQMLNRIKEEKRFSYINGMTKLLSNSDSAVVMSQIEKRNDTDNKNVHEIFKSELIIISVVYAHHNYFIEILNISDRPMGVVPSCESTAFFEGKIRHLISPQEKRQLKLDNWKRYDDYGTASKKSFVVYDTSCIGKIVINASYEFRLQDGKLYYKENHNEHLLEYHKDKLKDYLFRYLSKTAETITVNEKSFLMEKQPIQYSIINELGVQKVDWLIRESFYIGHRKFVPMYQQNSDKVMAIYYDKNDDSHNYVNGDKWCLVFEDGTYIELNVQTSPRRTNSTYNRFIVVSLNENDIDKLAENKLVKIQTKNTDAFDSTVSIIVQSSFQQLCFQEIFKTYKQAIQECGYIWGSDNDVTVEEPKSTECYVYIMHDEVNHYHKIGISNHPDCRERTLQSEKPSIVLLKAKKFPTRAIARAFESALHKSYSSKHIRGEWFNLSEDELKDIIVSLS